MVQRGPGSSSQFIEPDSKSSRWYDDDDDASTLKSFPKSKLYSPSNEEISAAGCSISHAFPLVEKLTSFMRQLFTSKQKKQVEKPVEKPVNCYEEPARNASSLLKGVLQCEDQDHRCYFIGEELLEVFIMNILGACKADATFVEEINAALMRYAEDIVHSPDPPSNPSGHLVYLVAAGVTLLKQNQGDKHSLDCLVPVLEQSQDTEALKDRLYYYSITSKLYKSITEKKLKVANFEKSHGCDFKPQSKIAPTFVHLPPLSRY